MQRREEADGQRLARITRGRIHADFADGVGDDVVTRLQRREGVDAGGHGDGQYRDGDPQPGSSIGAPQHQVQDWPGDEREAAQQQRDMLPVGEGARGQRVHRAQQPRVIWLRRGLRHGGSRGVRGRRRARQRGLERTFQELRRPGPAAQRIEGRIGGEQCQAALAPCRARRQGAGLWAGQRGGRSQLNVCARAAAWELLAASAAAQAANGCRSVDPCTLPNGEPNWSAPSSVAAAREASGPPTITRSPPATTHSRMARFCSAVSDAAPTPSTTRP